MLMSKNRKICSNCGRKMKQQFIGLQHCRCGISWKRDWTIVNKVDRKIKKAIQIGQEPKGY